jgi:hypothetical protein
VNRKLIRIGEGPGWRLTFKYHGGGNDVDILLEGNGQAVLTGLSLIGLVIGLKVRKMFERGGIPVEVFDDSMRLAAIASGGEPLSPYRGEYMRVEPVERVSGLTTQVSLGWKE